MRRGGACHPLPLLWHARALVTSLDSLLASLPFVSSLKERQAGLWCDASILQAHCGSVLLQRLPFNLFLPAFILCDRIFIPLHPRAEVDDSLFQGKHLFM